MIKKYNWISLLFGVPGLFMQVLFFLPDLELLGMLGILLFVIGLTFYAKALGRSPAWGLFGLLGWLGAIVLVFLKDKTIIDNTRTEEAEDPSGVLSVVNKLRRNIRRYFRSGLACIILWILLGIMMPSWRQPWTIGYRMLAFCLGILPVSFILFFHVIILLEIERFCKLVKKNIFITILYLLIAIFLPFGALLVPGFVIMEYNRRAKCQM